jgi:O-antigen/teichoic acid export membrane protein
MWKIFSSFDTILLGYFSNTGSVGIYNVIYSLSGLLLSITTAFGFTFLPLVSEAYSNREFLRMKRLYSIVAKWLLIFTITLSVPLIFFPELIIGSLFGEEYVKGNIALPILIIGFLLYSVAGLPSRVLKAVGKTKLIMYNSIIVAILNIVLNIILIPRFDFIGAAIATTIAYVVLSYLLFYESYYYTGIDPLSINTLLTSFVGFGAAFALYFTITKIFGISVVTMTAVMATFVPIYIILILRINGISSGEEYVIRILCEKTNLSADLVLRILQRISG